MAKSRPLQDRFLKMLLTEQVPVSVFLVNGIKLQGQVVFFDQFVLQLNNNANQLVYKHAISTIVPARKFELPTQTE